MTIIVNCYDKEGKLDSSHLFPAYITELDQMEDYVRAHILDPRIEKVVVTKRLSK